MQSYDASRICPESCPFEDSKSARKTPGQAQDTTATENTKRAIEAFEVFDHEQNKTVDVREIGTIIRSLGYCPSESELQEVLRDMEDPQQMGYIHVDRFIPVMTKIMAQQKFQPSPLETLQKAFQVLDVEGRGEIAADVMRKYFVEQGEPFSPDEMEEMLNAAVDPNSKTIQYKNFVHHLVIERD